MKLKYFYLFFITFFLFGCVSLKSADFLNYSPETKILFNGESFIVYKNTQIEADEEGTFYLKEGLIAKNVNLTKNLQVKCKIYGSSKWGDCNLVLLYVNKKINFDVNAHYCYVFKKNDWNFNEPARLIGRKNGYNIYGAFIPYSPYNETPSVSLRFDLKFKDELLIQFKHNFKNIPTEWENQTITFNRAKSTELSSTDQTNIKSERKKRFDIWAVNSDAFSLQTGFGYPVEDTSIISSEFGLHRKWVYTSGSPTSDVHTGLDYPNKQDTPILASADGTVKFAEYATYLGNAVFIDHGMGVYSVYMHNHKLNVEEGQVVKKGDIIAFMGMTGAATGPHSHWEVRIFGMPVDPRSLMFVNDIKF